MDERLHLLDGLLNVEHSENLSLLVRAASCLTHQTRHHFAKVA